MTTITTVSRVNCNVASLSADGGEHRSSVRFEIQSMIRPFSDHEPLSFYRRDVERAQFARERRIATPARTLGMLYPVDPAESDEVSRAGFVMDSCMCSKPGSVRRVSHRLARVALQEIDEFLREDLRTEARFGFVRIAPLRRWTSSSQASHALLQEVLQIPDQAELTRRLGLGMHRLTETEYAGHRRTPRDWRSSLKRFLRTGESHVCFSSGKPPGQVQGLYLILALPAVRRFVSSAMPQGVSSSLVLALSVLLAGLLPGIASTAASCSVEFTATDKTGSLVRHLTGECSLSEREAHAVNGGVDHAGPGERSPGRSRRRRCQWRLIV